MKRINRIQACAVAATFLALSAGRSQPLWYREGAIGLVFVLLFIMAFEVAKRVRAPKARRSTFHKIN